MPVVGPKQARLTSCGESGDCTRALLVTTLLITVITAYGTLDRTSSSEPQTAFISALVTEHLVLQTAGGCDGYGSGVSNFSSVARR